MEPIKKIVILGGGTTGWMCAAMLANSLSSKHISIELVESEEIGTVGVGESTVPPFMDMLASLGIDEVEFIKATQATFKLGIKFQDWCEKGKDFFHPFGKIDAGIDESSLYQLWLRTQLAGDACAAYMDFSPNAALAKNNKFVPYKAVQGSLLDTSRYALHLDAGLTAKYFKAYAQERGVKRTEGKVINTRVETDHSLGEPKIISLELERGQTIAGDFFLDCSGFRSLLLGDALGVEFIDWKAYLPCDRAVVVQSEVLSSDAVCGNLPPYTKATAESAGWVWRIPLQGRTGNGYVYSSELISDEDATTVLLSHVRGDVFTSPRVLHFNTGMRKQLWKSNCIAVGLAAGFIEPLESTAIHLAMRGVSEFLQQFPHRDCAPALAKEYNAVLAQDYEEIRDFIVLHYSATHRTDTPFWEARRKSEVPSSLMQSLAYYKASGRSPRMHSALFEHTSWRCLCEGMSIRPERYSSFVESVAYQESKQQLKQYVKQLNEVVSQVPTHREFVDTYCRADEMLKM